MAQDGAFARQHGAHVAAVRKQQWVPDRVDAGMKRVQAAHVEPMLDRVLAESRREKLTAAHDAMLTRRQ